MSELPEFNIYGDRPVSITIKDAHVLTRDTKPLLDTCLALALQHEGIVKASIFCGRRVRMEARVEPGTCEFMIRYTYTDGSTRNVYCIQHGPGAVIEFKS